MSRKAFGVDETDEEQIPIGLRYGTREFLLPPGRYMIGRSQGCHIVLDRPMVSRRHARLSVAKGTVTVEDLGSVNGVMVNGVPVGDKTRLLADGDRIDICGEELGVTFRPAAQPARQARTGSHTETILPDSEPPESGIESSSSLTQRADMLRLAGQVAARAIAAGRPHEAETVAQNHLMAVLAGVRKGAVPEPTWHAAFGIALDLAEALGDGRWIDYALELLTALRAAATAEQLERLRSAAGAVDRVDPGRADRYAAVLRAMPPGFERLRALHQIEALRRGQ